MTKHPQVEVRTPKGQLLSVDAGMANILYSLWQMDIQTIYSCERNHGRAYVMVPMKSARKLRKRVLSGINAEAYSPETIAVFQRFIFGEWDLEFNLFRRMKSKKFPGFKTVKTLWKYRRVGNPTNSAYVIRWTLSNIYGSRVIFRWPASASHEVLLALIEASQKKHGI